MLHGPSRLSAYILVTDIEWLSPDSITVDIPDGMYGVKTFHTDMETPIQVFDIGKPAPEA
jgi:hypothetical protein